MDSTVTDLTIQQKQGAQLQANGHSAKEIAAAVGVSAATVGRWRSNDEWRVEVSRYKDKQIASIEPLILKVKEHLVSGAIEATDSLREQLKATLPGTDSVPDWETRHSAAVTLLSSLKHATGEADKAPSDNVLAQALTINVGAEALGDITPAVRPSIDAEAAEE